MTMRGGHSLSRLYTTFKAQMFQIGKHDFITIYDADDEVLCRLVKEKGIFFWRYQIKHITKLELINEIYAYLKEQGIRYAKIR